MAVNNHKMTPDVLLVLQKDDAQRMLSNILDTAKKLGETIGHGHPAVLGLDEIANQLQEGLSEVKAIEKEDWPFFLKEQAI